jgi:hypothetical protein
VAAHFTYTFKGHFHGSTTGGAARVGGTLREDVTYNDGTAYSCTTNNQSWSATRETQGTQALPLPSGSYSGLSHQGYGVSFYVPAGGAHLHDVVVTTAGLGCAPAKSFNDHIGIGDVAVAADGSFSSTTTQDGVLFGVPAHFTYTFSGHFHGSTTGGATRLGGILREDVTYNDGTAYSCTSNNQTWSATRDTQGTLAPPLPPGAYAGLSHQGYGVSFTVSPDSAHLQTVLVTTVGLGCAPAKTFNDHLSIADVAVAGDGSFSATATQDGALFGTTAHFTYTFSGHFHGSTTGGTARVGGTLREDITYNDGTAYSCTSNNQTWSATH